jgi:hypothetical protein
MGKQHGIILKNHLPQMHKCSIFDRDSGKIDGKALQGIERLSAGSVIHYYQKGRGSVYDLEAVEIVAVPLEMAREDIYFLHHVLEVCYFFLPYESGNKEAFLLVELLLQNGEQLKYDWFKKIFLLQLFARLGMYPEDTFLNEKPIKQLLAARSLPHDYELDPHTHQALIGWLTSCLAGHPQRHLFKTLAIGIEHDMYKKS